VYGQNCDAPGGEARVGKVKAAFGVLNLVRGGQVAILEQTLELSRHQAWGSFSLVVRVDYEGLAVTSTEVAAGPFPW
jgi:hypothetical protein